MYRAEEDYLKTIYELTIQRKQDIVKTNEISDTFGFTDQSVNEMIKKLVHKKLVKFIPYKGVHLTKPGIKEAIRLLRAHRIWEVFLTNQLGYGWDEVDEDAEKLEHASSETLIRKLEIMLDYPKYCQHGNPIPSQEGEIAPFSTISLNELKEKESFIMTRVLDHKVLLQFLNEEKITLNKKYWIHKIDSFNHLTTIIDENDKETIISNQVGKMIFIKPL